MSAELIDGAALAAQTLKDVAGGVESLRHEFGRVPHLVTVLVGDDHASSVYVRMKVNGAREIGMRSSRIDLPAETTTDELIAVIAGLSSDDDVDGILLQHPVPPHIDERAAFEAIAIEKDVDGVTRQSLARMAFGEPGIRSATPGGIMKLLDAYDVELSGAEALVIGCSPILGMPVGLLLLAAGATVTYCHIKTVDLASAVARADVLVSATGQPQLVRGDWIKRGAVVIDAGYSRGRVGDVEFEAARERARLITPVPGGVGPMTIATLLEQTLAAASQRLGRASVFTREEALQGA